MRRSSWLIAGLAVVLVLAGLLGPPRASAASVDLGSMTLHQTVARVLTTPGATFQCTPPGTGPDPSFCVNDQPLFTPAELVVECPRSKGGPAARCVLEMSLCMDYVLTGAGVVGVAFFRVDLAVPSPGPDDPVATLRSVGLDPNHNRACTTQFAADLGPGSHAVVVGAGVDNNFSGNTVSIFVRTATAVIRVHQ